MSHTLRIARRELASFFNSPIAYIVFVVFLGVSGYLFFFFSGLFIVGRASMRGFFGLAPILFLFLVPAITMRLIAEERKSGTLETLMTLPLKEWEIVGGISDQVSDIGDELHAASDREHLREWGNQIDAPEKAH